LGMLIYDLFGSLPGENYRMVMAVGFFVPHTTSVA
jgi:hypothetical protein